MLRQLTIAIQGAGEMASGIAHRLYVSGFTRIIMSEITEPVAVRRLVCFCEAVYEGEMTVEGVRAERLNDMSELSDVWGRKAVAVIVDPEGLYLDGLKPSAIVDATMVKRTKTSIKRAGAFAIGVGPGFTAPDTVDAVVESNRGHDLGRVIYEGGAEPYSGMPGTMAGFTRERVLRAPGAGVVRTVKAIGDTVRKGEVVAYVDQAPVIGQIDGILRGMIRPIRVPEHEKIGDIDPRGRKDYCDTISDKARAIGGGVLEAIMRRFNAGS